MDDPAIDPALLSRALRDLDRLNRVGRTAAGLAKAIRRLVGDPAPDAAPCTVVDLGCGGGGVTIELARRLAAGGGAWRLVGVDASPACVEAAEKALAGAGAGAGAGDGARDARPSVAFEVARVGEDDGLLADLRPDVVVSSLFLHHLEDEPLDAVLAACARHARRAVVMDDLRRDRRSLALVRVGVRVLSRCPVVHVDGPRSVRAALTPAELRRRAEAAGLAGARVRSAGPARMRLAWRRPSAEATS